MSAAGRAMKGTTPAIQRPVRNKIKETMLVDIKNDQREAIIRDKFKSIYWEIQSLLEHRYYSDFNFLKIVFEVLFSH